MTEPIVEPRRGLGFGQVVAFLLGAAIVTFAVLNLSQVEVNFLVFKTSQPLFLLILAMGLIGFLVGLLARGRRR